MTIKRGLIFPRSGMGNVYYSQGLPRIYAQLAPNLKMLYDMSEGTGSYLYDKTGMTIGTLAAGDASGSNDSVQDMRNNAGAGGVNLDGVNDSMLINNVGAFTINSWFDAGYSWTIEFWVKFPSAFSGLQYWYKVNSSNYYYIVFTANTTTLSMSVRSGAGTTWISGSNSTLTIAANTPHHIVWTYNGNKKFSGFGFYIDGSSVSLTRVSPDNTAGITWYYSTPHPLALGHSYEETGALGYLAEESHYSLKGYNKVLSASEILTLYNYEKQFIR